MYIFKILSLRCKINASIFDVVIHVFLLRYNKGNHFTFKKCYRFIEGIVFVQVVISVC